MAFWNPLAKTMLNQSYANLRPFNINDDIEMFREDVLEFFKEHTLYDGQEKMKVELLSSKLMAQPASVLRRARRDAEEKGKPLSLSEALQVLHENYGTVLSDGCLLDKIRLLRQMDGESMFEFIMRIEQEGRALFKEHPKSVPEVELDTAKTTAVMIGVAERDRDLIGALVQRVNAAGDTTFNGYKRRAKELGEDVKAGTHKRKTQHQPKQSKQGESEAAAQVRHIQGHAEHTRPKMEQPCRTVMLLGAGQCKTVGCAYGHWPGLDKVPGFKEPCRDAIRCRVPNCPKFHRGRDKGVLTPVFPRQ